MAPPQCRECLQCKFRGGFDWYSANRDGKPALVDRSNPPANQVNAQHPDNHQEYIPLNGGKHPLCLGSECITKTDANDRREDGAGKGIRSERADPKPRDARGESGQISQTRNEVCEDQRPFAKTFEKASDAIEPVSAFQALNITTGQATERIARHDAAKRSSDSDGEGGAEAQHVLENEVTGEEQKELIRDRKTYDTQHQK